MSTTILRSASVLGLFTLLCSGCADMAKLQQLGQDVEQQVEQGMGVDVLVSVKQLSGTGGERTLVRLELMEVPAQPLNVAALNERLAAVVGKNVQGRFEVQVVLPKVVGGE